MRNAHICLVGELRYVLRLLSPRYLYFDATFPNQPPTWRASAPRNYTHRQLLMNTFDVVSSSSSSLAERQRRVCCRWQLVLQYYQQAPKEMKMNNEVNQQQYLSSLGVKPAHRRRPPLRPPTSVDYIYLTLIWENIVFLLGIYCTSLSKLNFSQQIQQSTLHHILLPIKTIMTFMSSGTTKYSRQNRIISLWVWLKLWNLNLFSIIWILIPSMVSDAK